MPDAIKSVDVPSVHGAVVLNPDGTSIGTPVGGASASNQTDGSQKTQIVDAGGEVVTVTGGKLDVNASASLTGDAIPATGATTAVSVQIVDGSGNQIASFGGGTQYTEGDTDASITGTALLWEDSANTLRPASAAKPFPVEIVAGAGSGGTAAADDADFTATTTSGTPSMGVYESTPTTVTDGDMGIVGITSGRRLKASSTIDAALPAGTNNIGDVDVVSSALPTGASTLAEQQTQTTHLSDLASTVSAARLQIDASTTNVAQSGAWSVTADAGTDLNTSALALESGGNLATIAGKDFATQTTLAAINTKMVTGTDIGDVTINNASGASAVNIQDGGNSITVDGTVAVTNAGITTIAGAVSGTEMQVDIVSAPTLTVNAHAVTNAGTFVVQENGASLTALQLIDDTVATTASAVPTKGLAISGTDGTNARVIKTDTSGELQVDVLTMPTVTVTATNLDVQSGGADLATSAQGAAIQTAVEIIDNAIAGSEMQVDVVAALPAGTNAIGKLAANSGVDIGDVTLTAGTAAIGTLLPPDIDVTTHTNYAKKYYTNAGAVTDGIVWSPAAGKRWHVGFMYINVSAAATVTLEDDLAGGDSPVWKAELAANSGIAVPFPSHYPLASGEDAADLIVTTTAGNVYITVVGYEI